MSSSRIPSQLFVLMGAALCIPAAQVAAEDVGWPRKFEKNGTEIILYQPQVDAWTNYAHIEFRSAVSIKRPADREPVFGVVENSATTRINHTDRTVLLTDLNPQVRFVGVNEADARALEAMLREAIPKRESIVVDLDRVIAYVHLGEIQARDIKVNLDPPPIYHSTEPALLVIFMGEPKFKPVDDTKLLFAANTNWDVFLETGSSQYYLLNGEEWLTAADPSAGVWQPARSLPADLSKLPAHDNWAEVKKHIPGKPAAKPTRVFVSKKPAELIITEGEPALSPIPGGHLMYVSNTENDLFLHSKEGNYYFLVTGRWFRAGKLAGPWEAATSSLPDDFAKIPENHPCAGVLASVPGTPESQEALIQASIPQKATVRRADLKLDVAYKGEPKFKPIDGSQGVAYATNTTFTVLQAKEQYYCCENGIWFVAPKATGPFVVCAEVPDEIYSIPESSPMHNVTYVYVYDSQPDTVTVGYTSGYEGAYASNGLLMFGAGMALGAILDDDDDWDDWWCSPCYYSYGCAARYGYYNGAFVRGGAYYGPYGGAGYAARYNPVTGTYARGAYAYGPYGSAGAARAYNPATGTYARGGYVSGPGGTVAAGGAYNPRTGAGAATRQVQTPYGSWGRSVVSDGDDWAKFGHHSGAAGTTAGVKTSEGGKGVVHKGESGWTYAGKTPSGDVYAGHNGNVYKREDGEWQQHSNEKRQWSNTGRKSYSQNQSRSRPEQWDRPQTGSGATAVGSQGDRARANQGGQGGAARDRQGYRSQGQPSRNRTADYSGGSHQSLNRDSWSRDRGNQHSAKSRSSYGHGSRGHGGGGGRGRGGRR